VARRKGGSDYGNLETDTAGGTIAVADEDELQALRRGVASDDPALLQGMMTMPPPLEVLHDWEVEGADLLAYPGWRARGLKTVKEVEECAWALCSAIDARCWARRSGS
jgi:hypothetical protein